MRTLYNIKDIIDDELKEISKKGELSEVDLDNVYKMIDICKDITTIEAMRHSGYSSEYSEDYPMSREGSYRSYGRYGRDGDGDGRYSERYSGHTPEHTREKLEKMMRNATTEQERESIRRILEQL